MHVFMLFIFYAISRTNVASVSSVFSDTRKVKVLSLPETIKEKSTFRARARRRELAVTPDEGPLLEASIFPSSFQVVREPLPFVYQSLAIYIEVTRYFCTRSLGSRSYFNHAYVLACNLRDLQKVKTVEIDNF